MPSTERVERIFSVPDGCQLDVRKISGSITVTGGEGDQVHLVATRDWRRRREAEATEIDIGQEGCRVWARTFVHGRPGWHNLWGRRRAETVDYVIELPRQSQVEARSVSASVEVSAIDGQVSVEAVSGSVGLRDIEGSVSIRTTSGDVGGHALRGQLELATVSGRAELADSDFSSVVATSVNGRLRIASPLHETGAYTAQTVSGSVELVVPATTDCTVEGHSTSGRLRTTLPHTCDRQGFGTWQIQVGDGGGLLRFNSVSGDLILTEAESGTAPGPAGCEPPEVVDEAEPQAAATTMDILRAIEAGRLSAEEGVGQLKELRLRRQVRHGNQ